MRKRKATSPHKRRLVMYAPSEKIMKKWKKEAKKKDLTISKYIFEIVENTINEEKNILLKKNKTFNELQERVQRLQNENIELQKKVDMLERLTDRYDAQLKFYQNKTFIENGKLDGVREYSKKLTNLFKKHGSIKEGELYDLLHLDPTDTDTTKAISNQIDHLIDYGVLERMKGGWRWRK
ncbi:MAG: hypothetical protein KGY50_04225 [Candidatus Thermoplasmatota archaeon]|nr:hypothetical protein [Candidatus Thermoplasmatota archaeon]